VLANVFVWNARPWSCHLLTYGRHTPSAYKAFSIVNHSMSQIFWGRCIWLSSLILTFTHSLTFRPVAKLPNKHKHMLIHCNTIIPSYCTYFWKSYIPGVWNVAWKTQGNTSLWFFSIAFYFDLEQLWLPQPLYLVKILVRIYLLTAIG